MKKTLPQQSKQKTSDKFAWNLNDLKFIKKGKKIHEDNKFAWALSDLIDFDERLDESEISQQAHAMGLKFAGWGKWKNSSGVVTHKSANGQLVPIGTKVPKLHAPNVPGVKFPGMTPKPAAQDPIKSSPVFEKPTGSVGELDDDEWETFAFNASVKVQEAKNYYSDNFLKDPEFKKFSQDLPSKAKKGVVEYSGSGHGDINRWLRAGKLHSKTEAQVKEVIASIDKAFDLAPRTSKPIMVFRGIEGGETVAKLMAAIKEKMTAGTEFEDPGFVSTSTIRSKAEGFGNALVFSIRIPKGSKGVIPLDIDGGSLTQHSSEYEALLRRGSRFRVRKIITEESPAFNQGGPVRTKMRVVLDFLGAPGNVASPAQSKPSATDAPFAAAEKPDEKKPVSASKPASGSTFADDLTFVKALGGTQGSKVYKSPAGKLYAVKGEDYEEYTSKPEWAKARVTGEKLANDLYTRFKLPTPKSWVRNKDGKPVLLTRYMENLEKIDVSKPEQKKAVQDGFAVDLLFGNRDVVGLEMDNVMWDPVTQQAYRLDNGASFIFRAQGNEKPFDVDTMWLELKGLRSHDKNLASAMFFGDLSDADVAKQVQEKIKPVDDEVLLGIISGQQEMPQEVKTKIYKGLTERKAALVKWADEYLAKNAPVQEYFEQFRL